MTHFLTRACLEQRKEDKGDDDISTGRRQFIAASLAAASVSMPLSAAMAAPQSAPLFPEGRIRSEFLSYSDPVEHQRQSYRVLRNMHDDADVLLWYHFQMYAVVDGGRPEAVVRWEGIEFSHHRKLAPSVYRVSGHNLSFPRDLKTGMWTDKARNPITDEIVTVPPMALTEDPGYVYTPEGVIPLDSPDAAPRIRHEQFLVEGDLIKIEQVRQPPASWPAMFIETSTNWSPLTMFENDEIPDLPMGTAGGYIFPWPKWMNMGDRKGHMFATWSGRKLQSIDNLPTEFIQRARGSRPDLLEVDMSKFSEPLPEPLATRYGLGSG
jgi:hypothetical protein